MKTASYRPESPGPAPRRRPVAALYVAAAGNAYSLTAAAGSFAETGRAAGLYVGRVVAASRGTFAETGQAAGLYKGSRLTAAAGSFAETGVAAGLYKGSRLTAAAGSFLETGVAAGLRATRLLTAAAGSFLETGVAAGLYKGRTLTATAGSFLETGVAAGLYRNSRLVAAAGTFHETGIDAELTHGAVVVPGRDRDRDIRAAAKALLEANPAFDNVYLTGTPDAHGQDADDTRSCSIDPLKEDYQFDGDYGGAVTVYGEALLTFITRDYDDRTADEGCERLFNAACNALNGQSLAGLTFPGFTRITRGQWAKRNPPERRKMATLEYRYLVDTWSDFGTDD